MKGAILFCALSSFAVVAAANDAMVLAPGKSVSVVDAEDPSIQVVVTAPADHALDLKSLLSTAGPKDSIYSIATRMQVNEARALVEAPDGSISLGGAPAAAVLPAPNITGGLVVFHRGRYAHYHAAPMPVMQTAARPGEQRIPGKDEVPVPGRVAGATPVLPAAPVGPATAAALPTGGQVIVAGPSSPLAISQTTGAGVINWQSFNIGSSGSVTFSQPSAGSVTLNNVTGGQTPVFGTLTSGGQVQLTSPIGGTTGSVKVITTGAPTPGGTTFIAR